MGDKIVEITQEEYDQLIADSKWLACLEDAGVDNWSGYDFAVELFQDWDGTE